MYDQGVVSEYDLIRARVAVSNLQPQVIEAKTGLELTRKGLKHLIGLDVDQPVRITGDLDEDNRIELSYEQACKIALDRRIEIHQLDLQKKMYDKQFILEKRNILWPNLFANIKWETTAQSDLTDFSKYEFLNGLGGTLALQIPLLMVSDQAIERRSPG